MKHIQSTKDTFDRLGDHVLVLRRKLHSIRRDALKSLGRNSPESPGIKIDIIRNTCELPLAPTDPLHEQSFPQFVEFPTEIRLLIWHFASVAGREVELQWSEKEIGFRNCTAPRPPAVLYACRDSREAKLKTSHPYFILKERRKPICVNPVNDILCFRISSGSSNWAWRHEWMQLLHRQDRMELLREELKGVRRLTFLWRDFKDDSMPISVDPLYLLPGLEELVILCADGS